MGFPERVYTAEEVQKARELIDKGYRHSVKIEGSPSFKREVARAVEIVKSAGYYDFLASYICRVVEIDGLTQLHEADCAVWANGYAVRNPVDFASVLVQKSHHMREYLEGKLYYGGAAEKRSVTKRIEFLTTLKNCTEDKDVASEAEKLLKFWRESSLVY
jgi:hypothetical protein